MARRSTRRTGRPGNHVADVGGPSTEHRDRADTADLAHRNAVATRHLADGRLRAAVIALESLLYDCRHALGGEDPETLIVEGNLAVAHVKAGQQEAGAQVMSANLVGRERVFGDLHPLTLTARDALATTHRLAGRLSEAMWLYSRVAPQRNEVLGPSHPDTLTTRLGLGLTFAEAGDTAMAHDVFTAALEDCGQAAADGHIAILRSCIAELRDAATAPAADPAVGDVIVPRQRGASTLPTDGRSPPRHERGREPAVDGGPVQNVMT